MFGLAAATWTVISTVLGLSGVLLLFYYGMPGLPTNGRTAHYCGQPYP
jgi:hypothetical protein